MRIWHKRLRKAPSSELPLILACGSLMFQLELNPEQILLDYPEHVIYSVVPTTD